MTDKIKDTPTLSPERAEYLQYLRDRIDKAQSLADCWPSDDGWGGGYRLPDDFPWTGSCNLSDLLHDIVCELDEYITAGTDAGGE